MGPAPLVVDVVEPVVGVDVLLVLLLAITGAMGESTGADVVIPEGKTESLGYAEQVTVDGLPEVFRVNVVVGSTKRDTLLGGAVLP
jgi:hypothetical protein